MLRIVVALTLCVVIVGIAGTATARAQSSASSSASSGSSSSSSAPSCDDPNTADITAVLTTDGHATFTVANALPLCDPVPIGVAVYTKDGDGFVVPQALAGSTTDTISTGSKALAVTLPAFGTGPACYFQIDAFVGDVLPEITDTSRYDDRLRAGLFGQFSTCVLSESTSTSSSTTTTTTAVVSATSTPPPTVLGETITRDGAMPLARTGPVVDVSPLVAASGWLLFIGGGLLALAYGFPRRAR
jgi:hypothetical protein